MLYHATSNSNFLRPFELSQLARDLVFRFLSDRTGVEDNDISFSDFVCIRKSASNQYCFDSRTICVIHLTSNYQYVKFHGRAIWANKFPNLRIIPNYSELFQNNFRILKCSNSRITISSFDSIKVCGKKVVISEQLFINATTENKKVK